VAPPKDGHHGSHGRSGFKSEPTPCAQSVAKFSPGRFSHPLAGQPGHGKANNVYNAALNRVSLPCVPFRFPFRFPLALSPAVCPKPFPLSLSPFALAPTSVIPRPRGYASSPAALFGINPELWTCKPRSEGSHSVWGTTCGLGPRVVGVDCSGVNCRLDWGCAAGCGC
jgi:hypothetical protein